MTFICEARRSSRFASCGPALMRPSALAGPCFPPTPTCTCSIAATGRTQLEASGRLAANFDRFNLATNVSYRRQYVRAGPSPPAEVRADLIGSGHLGDVRLRGAAGFDLSPSARFRTAEVSAYWSKSDRVDWEAALAYEAVGKRARARLTHVSRLDTMSLALTGEAASDGAVAVGINLSFSLDPGHGLAMSRRQLAQSGAIHATVYRDLNDNGTRDPAEPLEKGALVTTGTTQAARATNAKGAVTVAGLTAYAPIAVGIDETSLSRPHADAQEGAAGGRAAAGCRRGRGNRAGWRRRCRRRVTKSGGLGFEGLDIELIDAAGKVAGWARSDFDGFFLFERVAYGRYTIRVPKDSAAAAKILTGARRRFGVSAAKSVVRPRHASRVRARSRRRLGRRRARGVRQVDWCGREDSNFHGLSATATSTLRVYQFRHDRT